MTDVLKTNVPENICEYLTNVFGSVWKHDGNTRWYSKDGRLVSEVTTMRITDDSIVATIYYLYSEYDHPIVITFDIEHDFCEQSKSEERTFGSTVCIDCNLYKPHVCLESPTRCEEMYKSGELKKEPNSCSKWLCNCGGCPHSKQRINRFDNLSMINTDNIASKKSMINENKETRILTEQDLENVPEHLREMVRIQNNKNKRTVIPINTYPISPLMHDMLAEAEEVSHLPNTTKMFPVHNVITKHKNVALIREIPYEVLEAYDETIKKRHGNSLDALSKSGGLPADCIIAILEEREWCEMDVVESSMRLRDLLFEKARNKNNFLQNATISFNPSVKESVQSLLALYGPEGLCEIAKVLEKAAVEDMTLYEDMIG